MLALPARLAYRENLGRATQGLGRSTQSSSIGQDALDKSVADKLVNVLRLNVVESVHLCNSNREFTLDDQRGPDSNIASSLGLRHGRDAVTDSLPDGVMSTSNNTVNEIEDLCSFEM